MDPLKKKKRQNGLSLDWRPSPSATNSGFNPLYFFLVSKIKFKKKNEIVDHKKKEFSSLYEPNPIVFFFVTVAAVARVTGGRSVSSSSSLFFC